MRVERCQARRSFEEAAERFDLKGLEDEIATHNAATRLTKRGVAAMPVCFGISFTNAMLNQAGALVHVYTDGSVSVSTGAIEMGQGSTPRSWPWPSATLGRTAGPHPDREHDDADRRQHLPHRGFERRRS